MAKPCCGTEELEKQEKPSVSKLNDVEIKEVGWIEVKLDPKDSRKRIYQLKNPEEAIKKMEK